MISLVVFDVNGVLYDYDKPARLLQLSRLSGRPPDAIDQAIWQSGFEDRGDAGDFSAAAYLQGFGALLAHPLSTEAYLAALTAALTPIAPMLALAARLSARARLATQTNNNLLVREHMDRLFPALPPIFGADLCVSAEFSSRKPKAAVFRHTLARLGATAAETLFIDDSAANAAGAAAAGLVAHRHSDRAALEQRLAALGLLEINSHG